MRIATKITLALLAAILTAVLTFSVYFLATYHPDQYIPGAEGLDKLSFVVDGHEFYMMGSVYGDFLLRNNLIDATTDGLESGDFVSMHEARDSWRNIDIALSAYVCLHNDGEIYLVDPLCKMSRIELFQSFTYQHEVSVGGIDIATGTEEDIIALYGEPDIRESRKKFVKPLALIDRMIYFGQEEDQMTIFNLNHETGVIESVEIQAVPLPGHEGSLGFDGTSALEPIRAVDGKPRGQYYG